MPQSLYSSVYAGDPLPIDGGEIFDLAEHLITHPNSTFYVRVSGDSMIEAGIQDGDILIVDSSREPHSSNIVVAQIGDGFTVKRFCRDGAKLRLVSANSKPVECCEGGKVCGVATFAIKRLLPVLTLTLALLT